MDSLGCEHIRHVFSYLLTQGMSIGAPGREGSSKLDEGGVKIRCNQCDEACLLVLTRPAAAPVPTGPKLSLA